MKIKLIVSADLKMVYGFFMINKFRKRQELGER